MKEGRERETDRQTRREGEGKRGRELRTNEDRKGKGRGEEGSEGKNRKKKKRGPDIKGERWRLGRGKENVGETARER